MAIIIETKFKKDLFYLREFLISGNIVVKHV